MTLDKDDSIRELVARLELGRRGWVVIDHWEADLCAVGVAAAGQPRRLVYVSTYDKAPQTYDYQCELPDDAEPSGYRTVVSGDDVPFAELVAALERHLGGDG